MSPDDQPHLVKWLMEPGILRWFPMINEREVEDASRVWISYCKLNAGLCAELDGVPCGLANLYLNPYKKLRHQCLFSIIVADGFRGKGVGTILLENLKRHAKDTFQIELLHLEAYEGNPAIRLYQRAGFVEYGRHPDFLKENGHYQAKIFMQQFL
jgi:putative acetyltransferase